MISWRGPSPHRCALATQFFPKKCRSFRERWQRLSDLTGPRFEPETRATEKYVLPRRPIETSGAQLEYFLFAIKL